MLVEVVSLFSLSPSLCVCVYTHTHTHPSFLNVYLFVWLLWALAAAFGV